MVVLGDQPLGELVRADAEGVGERQHEPATGDGLAVLPARDGLLRDADPLGHVGLLHALTPPLVTQPVAKN